MINRKDLIRMTWREDDTIRFYLDTPDKRGVGELLINNRGVFCERASALQ